jgi:hypothetical protein
MICVCVFVCVCMCVCVWFISKFTNLSFFITPTPNDSVQRDENKKEFMSKKNFSAFEKVKVVWINYLHVFTKYGHTCDNRNLRYPMNNSVMLDVDLQLSLVELLSGEKKSLITCALFFKLSSLLFSTFKYILTLFRFLQ